MADDGVFAEGHLGLGEGDIEQLALARDIAGTEGAEHADRQVEPADHVADAHANAEWRLVGVAVEAHGAAHRLRDGIDGGVLAIGACLAVAAEGGVNEPWVFSAQGFVAQPEAVHGAGAEVLRDDIDRAGEALDEGLAFRGLEVDGDALFAAVDAEEEG